MKSVIVKSVPLRNKKSPLIIVVSAKVSKKATERNKLKRRIRNIMRYYLTGDRAYKIITRPEAMKLNFQELKEEMEKQIRTLANGH